MKVIAVSLYGEDDRYILGALRLVKDAKRFYPDWFVRFYVGESVPNWVMDELTVQGAQIVRVVGREDESAMFWRFRALSDEFVDIVLVRDCDSAILEREVSAVEEWIKSGKVIHIMRDHPIHNAPILGGMWGARAEEFRWLQPIIEGSTIIGRYGEDQEFLTKHIYRKYRRKAMVHDSYFIREINRKRFPDPRIEGEYIGEVISSTGEFDPRLRQMATRYERNFLLKSYIRIKALFLALKGR